MRSGSKTISTASAWPGCFLYVGLSFSPPVYPTLVEMTPSRRRSSSWTPQKQPPARMAVSVLSLIVVSLLRRFCVRLLEGDPLTRGPRAPSWSCRRYPATASRVSPPRSTGTRLVVDLVEVREVRVGHLDPAPRGSPDLVGERREADRYGRRRRRLNGEAGPCPSVLPVVPGGGASGARKPIERDVVDDVLLGQVPGRPAVHERTGDLVVAVRVVV